MLSSHQIEPELLQPLPRPLCKRAGHQGFGCIRLLLLPFIIVGGGLLITTLFSTLVSLCGHWVPGRVTGRHTGVDEDGTSYYLEYSYRVAGADYQSAASVSTAEYDSYANGTPVSVRVLTLWPQQGSQLGLPGCKCASDTSLRWGLALFWNGLLSLFVWMFYIMPMKTRWVVARGVPTVGHIYEKKISISDDGTLHLLLYEYEPPGYEYEPPDLMAQTDSSPSRSASPFYRAVPLKGQVTVTATEYDQAQVGDVVTVLCHPKNPRHSVIYRYADYEVLT